MVYAVLEKKNRVTARTVYIEVRACLQLIRIVCFFVDLSELNNIKNTHKDTLKYKQCQNGRTRYFLWIPDQLQKYLRCITVCRIKNLSNSPGADQLRYSIVLILQPSHRFFFCSARTDHRHPGVVVRGGTSQNYIDQIQEQVRNN